MFLPGSYAYLPAQFFARIEPTLVADPRLITFNADLAEDLGLATRDFSPVELAEIFSGNRLLAESRPIAMAYAGHQFGHFVPMLGDGRAILLGEARDRAGTRRDIQLKGSGRTPYSRDGDGRAAVGPVLREYAVSEAMHALGLPTTRALAAVATGESVFRDRLLPGAILTRVAASHVRVGTFQYFAARSDIGSLKRLADYVVQRHYPDAALAANPYLELLRCVVGAQARLVAGWMNVGFIHGVMNTDNMAISGETIDFGPCAFMDSYDPATVFSSIDRMGRYSYANQPAAAQWNLARLAETLLPLIDGDGKRALELATREIEGFAELFEACWLTGMRRKLGLFSDEEGDLDLARTLLDVMHRSRADYTRTMLRLCAAAEGEAGDGPLEEGFAQPAEIREWVRAWRSRLARESQPARQRAASMRRANPFVIPRNHRIEAAISAAVENGDFAPFEQLSRALALPYEHRIEFEAYADPPRPEERVLRTFCGT